MTWPRRCGGLGFEVTTTKQDTDRAELTEALWAFTRRSAGAVAAETAVERAAAVAAGDETCIGDDNGFRLEVNLGAAGARGRGVAAEFACQPRRRPSFRSRRRPQFA